jgi:hypothetical protein
MTVLGKKPGENRRTTAPCVKVPGSSTVPIVIGPAVVINNKGIKPNIIFRPTTNGRLKRQGAVHYTNADLLLRQRSRGRERRLSNEHETTTVTALYYNKLRLYLAKAS